MLVYGDNFVVGGEWGFLLVKGAVSEVSALYGP